MAKFVYFNMVSGEDEDGLETYKPVAINAELIRSFHSRKENRPGSRIEFANSSALVVEETYEAVKAAVAPN